jgi:hypothetical protein
LVRTLLAMLAVAAILTTTLCACSSSTKSGSTASTTVATTTVPSAPGHHAIAGVLAVVQGVNLGASGSPCASSTYTDIAPGDAVIVSDAAGNRIGTGKLSSGHSLPPYECDFQFTVANVVDGPVYNFAVGNHGLYKRSFLQMTQSGWRVGMQLSDGDSSLVTEN